MSKIDMHHHVYPPAFAKGRGEVGRSGDRMTRVCWETETPILAVGCNVVFKRTCCPYFLTAKTCKLCVAQRYLLTAGPPVAPHPLKGMKPHVENDYCCVSLPEAMAHGYCQSTRF